MYSSRTESVSPGSRCWAWFPAGGQPLPASVPVGFEIRYPASYWTGGWNQQWAWEIRVAKTVAPGTYDVGQVKVTVVAKPPLAKRPESQIGPTTSGGTTIQSEVRQGWDVFLKPGRYLIERPIVVPHGATIYASPGSVQLVRLPDSEYANRMFIPTGPMTLRGLTMTHHEDIDPAQIVYLHNHPMQTGHITVDSCTVIGGNLSRGMPPGMWVRRTKFRNSGTGDIGSNSVYERCRFRGHTAPGQHSYFNTGAQGVLTFDCTWNGTTRGQVLQTGPCRGSMNLNLHFHGIRGGENNANEVILLEGGNDGHTTLVDGMQSNTFCDIWIDNCGGPAVSIHGSGISETRLWNFTASTDHQSLAIAALNGGQISNTECHNWQVTGGMNLIGDVGKLTLGNYTFHDGPRFAPSGAPPDAVKSVVENWPVRMDAVAREKCRQTLSNCGVGRAGAYQPLLSL